jgi:hydroxypyruvate reductase/glycerate 2-kinase
LRAKVPPGVVSHLERGAAGELPETPKQVPANVVNRIVGSNRLALAAAEAKARELGYHVWNAGSDIEGETRDAATRLCHLAMRVRMHHDPVPPPVCILSGGETTVTLGDGHGRGGRNQEFALAALTYFGGELGGITALSGGTDGEDGPTDAAGAIADTKIRDAARTRQFDARDFLHRHDAYTFFDGVGGLLRTGLTGTNVMDVRVILVR